MEIKVLGRAQGNRVRLVGRSQHSNNHSGGMKMLLNMIPKLFRAYSTSTSVLFHNSFQLGKQNTHSLDISGMATASRRLAP